MANPLFNVLNFNQSNTAPQQSNNMQSLKQAYQQFKNAKNPNEVIYSLVQKNPRLQPMLQIMNGGTNYEQVFRGMCQSRGINPDAFIKELQS